MPELLAASAAELLAAPLFYLGTGVLTFAAMLGYAYSLDRQLNPGSVGWILYLLVLSVWEEVFFRLAIPYFGQYQPGVDAIPMALPILVIGSNLAFGAIHYFTLRWKWPWCLVAFIGGMALSRNLHQHFDLALIIALHWVATFINTPRLPGQSKRSEVGL